MGYSPRKPFYCGMTKTEYILDKNGKKTGAKTLTCKNKAKDATDEIDIVTIVDNCEKLAEYAESLHNIKNDIKFDMELITNDILCINGKGISGLSTECDADMNVRITTNIIENVNSVKETAIGNFEAKQSLYDQQAKNRCHTWQ